MIPITPDRQLARTALTASHTRPIPAPKIMATSQASRPESKWALLVLCVECGEGVEVPLPIDYVPFLFFLAQRGWFTSVLKQPAQDPEAATLFAALCTPCAQKVYPPEVFKIADERRQQLVQQIEAAAATARRASEPPPGKGR